jgi:hypothetical protein
MAAAPPGLIPFRIKDQHDRLHTDARYRHAPLLVVWGDRKGSEYMAAWTTALADSLARPLARYRIRLLEVAHGKGAPFFVKGKIKGSFRDDGRGPVLMDWDGAFARAYACREDSCNVLLFDGESGFARGWVVAGRDGAELAAILDAARAAID